MSDVECPVDTFFNGIAEIESYRECRFRKTGLTVSKQVYIGNFHLGVNRSDRLSFGAVFVDINGVDSYRGIGVCQPFEILFSVRVDLDGFR